MRTGAALEQRRLRAGVSKLRTLNDLVAEYLMRRKDLIVLKTLKIERDLLQGVLAPAVGDRLLADLEPIDFGKAVEDYAGRLKREGRSNRTNVEVTRKGSTANEAHVSRRNFC